MSAAMPMAMMAPVVYMDLSSSLGFWEALVSDLAVLPAMASLPVGMNAHAGRA